VQGDLIDCASAHGQSADLGQQKQVAAEKLNALIASLSFGRGVTENEPTAARRANQQGARE
jgi:hypothetical protein